MPCGVVVELLQIQAGAYLEASPDPISPFSGPVAGHMNADHGNASIAMVKKYTGLPVEDAKIVNLDRLGMNMMGTFNGMSMKVTLSSVLRQLGCPVSSPDVDRCWR